MFGYSIFSYIKDFDFVQPVQHFVYWQIEAEWRKYASVI